MHKSTKSGNQLDALVKKTKVTFQEKKNIYNLARKIDEYVEGLQEFEAKVHNKKHNTSTQSQFNKMQRKIISIMYKFEKEVKPAVLKKYMGNLFRKKACRYICKSKILERAYKKPRGYPGDYLTFEEVYINKPLSKNIGYYFDVWVLTHFLTIGVQYRKNEMKKMLKQSIETSEGKKFKILNIGCGACKEIRELLTEKKHFKQIVSFTCLDQDNEALSYAEKHIKKEVGVVDVNFIKGDVLTLMGLGNKDLEIKQQDIIYSLGLADYFLETTLKNFVQFCYNKLKENGKFIIAFCSSYDPKLYFYLRWFCDWNFYINDAEAIGKIVKKQLRINKVKVLWEKPKPVFFIIVEK